MKPTLSNTSGRCLPVVHTNGRGAGKVAGKAQKSRQYGAVRRGVPAVHLPPCLKVQPRPMERAMAAHRRGAETALLLKDSLWTQRHVAAYRQLDSPTLRDWGNSLRLAPPRGGGSSSSDRKAAKMSLTRNGCLTPGTSRSQGHDSTAHRSEAQDDRIARFCCGSSVASFSTASMLWYPAAGARPS